MILRKIDYREFDGEQNYWALKNLTLGKINLLVGKNATGKTNTITKIAWLGNMLAGLQPQLLNSGNYYAEFADGNDVYKYYLQISKLNIVLEKLEINDEEKFSRSDTGTGEIYADELKCKIKFQLPPNQLLVVSRRDTIQHPYLEKIHAWADGLRFYEFGSQLGKDTVLIVNDMKNISIDSRDMNSVIGLFIKGEQEFPQDFGKNIIESMKKIGYELSKIGITFSNDLLPPVPLAAGTNGLVLYAHEKDSKADISQPQMSQGMFRTLSLIIQITYNTLKKLSTTILIDDIGEGLDFDRSTKLIELLIDLAKKNDTIQLIMSTNDRYVMNNVPLEYWQVIQRDGGECRVFNYQNSKEKFDEFEYTGLNNFDFLSTDYINSEWEKS
jgi:predicted ATPase